MAYKVDKRVRYVWRWSSFGAYQDKTENDKMRSIKTLRSDASHADAFKVGPTLFVCVRRLPCCPRYLVQDLLPFTAIRPYLSKFGFDILSVLFYIDINGKDTLKSEHSSRQWLKIKHQGRNNITIHSCGSDVETTTTVRFAEDSYSRVACCHPPKPSLRTINAVSRLP